MARKRHGTPRTLEPEAPDMFEAPAKSTKRVRPAAGQTPPTLDEALASVALTVGVRLIERMLKLDTPPRSASVPDFDRTDGRMSVRACGGNHYLCGQRTVLDHWRFCPYCATEFKAVQ